MQCIFALLRAEISLHIIYEHIGFSDTEYHTNTLMEYILHLEFCGKP